MMADPQPIPIYKGQDFWVPQFKVTLRGRPVDQKVVNDILSVEYHDGMDEIDSFKLVVNNWDPEKRSFRYSDENLFLPGARLDLEMGYREGSALRKVITGEITELSPTFPAGGQPVLNVSGLNILHKFRTEHVDWVYINKTDTAIAREVGGRLNVDIKPLATAAAEPLNEYVLQANQYDIIFLFERARHAGYDLFVDEKAAKPTLCFGPSEKAGARPLYELVYGRSLIDFQPTLTTANQVGQVVVRAWDAVKKKVIEGTAKRADLRTKGVGKAGGQPFIDPAFDKRREIIVDRPVRSKAEADRLAREQLERIAKGMVTASGSIVGLPDLRAGSVIVIDGVGTRFSGRYFVTKTAHIIGDGGYTTRFDCRREELTE
jgi:phage protein D